MSKVNENPRRWLFQPKKTRVISGICLIALLLLISMCFLYEADCCVFPLIGEFKNLKYVNMVVKAILEKDGLVKFLGEMFNNTWIVTVNIMIFLLGISNTYQYGVPLKRILKLLCGKMIIIGWAFIYIYIYIVMNIACLYSFRVTAVCCMGSLFFVLLLFVCIYGRMFRKKAVRQLLKIKTKEQIVIKIDEMLEKQLEKRTEELLKRMKKYLYEKAKKGKDEKIPGKKYSTHVSIDRLPITDMLNHIDYANAMDVTYLSSILLDVIIDQDMLQKKLHTVFMEHTLLMTWINHIVIQSGTKTEIEKTRTINTLIQIWQEIRGRLNLEFMQKNISTEEKEKMSLSFSTQLLIPLIMMQNEDGNEVLQRIWRTMDEYKEKVLVYLLLYSEYQYWLVNRTIGKWFLDKNYGMSYYLKQFMKGNIYIEDKFARELWLEWSQYETSNGDIGLSKFSIFLADISQIKKGNWIKVKSQIFMSLNFCKE